MSQIALKIGLFFDTGRNGQRDYVFKAIKKLYRLVNTEFYLAELFAQRTQTPRSTGFEIF